MTRALEIAAPDGAADGAGTHLKAIARSTLLPRSMTFLPTAGTSACAACFLAK